MSLLTVHKLELQNFMTHRQESVELPEQGSVLLWGPSGAGKCLPAGTSLWSADGSPVRIEEVVLGRIPAVMGVVENRVCEVAVTDWHQMGKKPILGLHLKDGSSLLCADTHRVRTMVGCLEAKDIVPGMKVCTAAPAAGSDVAWAEVDRISEHPEMECFDITVDTLEHLYIAENFVVHNSSLLDAVGFALYGVNATRAASLDELRHELYPEEDFGVRLTLSLGDKQIQVFRGVESGKTVTWMVGADGEMTEGPRAVSEQIAELMGSMDAATFFATYYSQQGELDALVKMAGGGRRKFVQRMLGITLLDKVTTQINRELLKASERIDALDDSLPQQSKQELTEMLRSAEQSCGGLEKEIESCAAQLEALKVQGESLSEALKASEAEARETNKLTPQVKALEETTLPALREQIEKNRQQIEEAEQAKAQLSASRDLLEEITALQGEAESLSQAEGALSAVSRLEEELTQAEAALAALPEATQLEDPKALQEELHRLHTETAILSSREEQVSGQLSELEGAGSCPLCRQQIDDPAALLSELQAEIASIKQNRQRDKEELQKLEIRLSKADQADQAMKQRLEAEQAAKQAENSLQEAREGSQGADAARLQQVRAALQGKAQQQAELQNQQKLAESLPQITKTGEQVAERLSREQAKLSELQSRLLEIKHDPQKHSELAERTEAARAEYMELRDRIASLREARSEAKAQLSALRNVLETYDAIVEDRRKAESRHGLLKRLDSSMKNFKAHMIGQIRPSLQATASAHLSALTEGRMSGVEIDEEYNIEVLTADGKRRLGLCSGGEQARVAFALRLALTQLVSSRTDTPVGFMVFDEIFGSQDEGHRRAILESLRYVRGLLPQVLFISHEQSLRESDLIDTIVDVPDSESASRIQVSAR